MTELMKAAEAAMETEADVRIDVRSERRRESASGSHFHRHIAIEWEGGVIWLDTSDLKDHYCIDVRQFVPGTAREMPGVKFENDPDLAGQGVFTIVNGRRQALAHQGEPRLEEMHRPLHDLDGTPVLGHGWNAGYVVTLMHDKAPSEQQTNRPAGPGRG